MSRIIDPFIFIIILFLDVSLLMSDYWWVANIQLFLISGLIKNARGSQVSGLVFIILGTVIVDFIMFRNIGLIAIFYIISILATIFISKFLKIIGTPGSSMYLFVIFIVFHIINNSFLFFTNVLSLYQIGFILISSSLILVGLLLLTSVKNKTRNAFKI
jgi:hypothetical protein